MPSTWHSEETTSETELHTEREGTAVSLVDNNVRNKLSSFLEHGSKSLAWRPTGIIILSGSLHSNNMVCVYLGTMLRTSLR